MFVGMEAGASLTSAAEGAESSRSGEARHFYPRLRLFLSPSWHSLSDFNTYSFVKVEICAFLA